MGSPCTKKCALDSSGTHCTGCGRSLEDIKKWAAYSDAERQRIVNGLKIGKEPKK